MDVFILVELIRLEISILAHIWDYWTVTVLDLSQKQGIKYKF